ncbi:hypothetical protein MY4824_008858 [Beauveria thailandica]
MEDGPITSIAEPGIKAEGQLLYTMRNEVANLLGRSQTGFPGAQPVSFARKHIDSLKTQDYYVCEKSDGIRYLLYATRDESGAEAHYLIDRKNDYWFITNRNLHFPLDSDQTAFHIDTVLDGELVWDSKPNGGREPRFLIFDCLVMDGQVLMDRTLDKRLAYIRERFHTPYKRLFKEFPEELKFQPFFVEMKPFQLAYGIEMMFKQVLPHLKHGNDGLIFTCRHTPYRHGTDPHILKWKPPEENTIDFLLKLHFPTVQPNRAERALGRTEPFVDYDSVPHAELMVFTGGNGPERYETFQPLYLTKQEWETLKGLGDPLNDRIVECNQDDKKRWRLLRFRDDKLEANHKTTVTSVLQSIKDRVTKQDLHTAAARIRDNWKARQARGERK